MAIILILIGLVLPAARKLMDERKTSTAENTIRGLLMTARADALRLGAAERGLFFSLDDSGVQRIVPIERDQTGPQACSPQPGCQAAWQNVFRVMGEGALSLPAPIRVVPRYVVDDPGDDADQTMVFDEDELANNNFDVLPGSANQAQRHRNYFTIVFSNDGSLLVRRDVLLLDPDADGDGRGDITGLAVGHTDDDPPGATVRMYYRQNDAVESLDPTTPPGSGQAILDLVIDADDNDDVALNFPSVDGLLVYDDSVFRSVDTIAQRDFLLRTARPYYLNRLTGAIIRGPLGENVAP